jgi:hypothetical protein
MWPAWVAPLLNDLANIIGITAFIRNMLGNTDSPYSLPSLLFWIKGILAYVSDPVYGLASLKSKLDNLSSDLAVDKADLLAAIAAAQQAANPVILPTTPPTGYGGGLASGDVASIWNYIDADAAGYSKGDLVDDAGFLAQNLGQLSAFKTPYGDYVRQHYDLSTETLIGPSSSPPIIDPSTILATDATVVDWLNRTDTGGFTWTYLNNLPISYSHITISDQWWICDISDYQFSLFKAVAPVAGLGAPVWPGLALVTLGTPVTITTAMTIAVPLHGVIVTLTAEPSKSSFWSFDGINSYRNLGALSFTTDDGQQEPSQSLGFTSGIYTPHLQVQAAGVKVRTVGGVAGTVTPWVIT